LPCGTSADVAPLPKTNVTPAAAGQATAVQLFARLPAGQFFRPLNGNWTRKI